MTLIDREKALVEAARRFEGACTHASLNQAEIELSAALRAYDPPKQKVYALPEWNLLSRDKQSGIEIAFDMTTRKAMDAYESLRRITAKEQE